VLDGELSVGVDRIDLIRGAKGERGSGEDGGGDNGLEQVLHGVSLQ
jgi:hypothetical protein